MNMNFKGLIYGALGVIVLVLAIKFFIHVLPWLLIIGTGIYLYSKAKKFIKEKKSRNNKKINNNEHYDLRMDSYSGSSNYNSGDIIDVDYEEVDENQK